MLSISGIGIHISSTSMYFVPQLLLIAKNDRKLPLGEGFLVLGSAYWFSTPRCLVDMFYFSVPAGKDAGWWQGGWEELQRQKLLGGLEHEFYFPIYWVANHPNWLSYFSEGFKPPTSKKMLIHPAWSSWFIPWTHREFYVKLWPPGCHIFGVE